MYAIARYARGDDCKAIEELGGIPVTADMANPDTFAAIREDVDYVITWSIRTFEQILEG